MAKFGRFEFKAQEPAETYEGDFMTINDKSHVRIFVGKRSVSEIGTPPRLVAVIALDKGQSVREIKVDEPAAAPPDQDDTYYARES